MSLAGRVRLRGSVVDVYRPSYQRTADGNYKIGTWNDPIYADLKILLQPVSDEIVQKIFGGSALVRDRGFVAEPGCDIRAQDVVVVKTGRHAGKAFRVEDPRPQLGRRLEHLELALVSTTERP